MQVKHWRSIIFQILSVLAIIQNKYPGFRHNDMKANNILIHNIDIDETNKKYLYKINQQQYIVPNIGFQIKLWDFDFACIPGIVNNSKVEAEWTNKINIKPEQNKYYDIHYFFNTLIRKGFFPEFLTAEEIPQKVRLVKLNQIAIQQMKVLMEIENRKMLK
jgi:serine/threonine protein kinase